jgi:hypothetical protein
MVGAGVPVGGEEGHVGRSGWLWAGLVRKRGSGPTQERNSMALYLFEIFQNLLEWIRSKDGLPEMEKIQIKYIFDGFELGTTFLIEIPPDLKHNLN